MKIAFFGDSYTQGTPYPTDYEKIWPNIIANHYGAEADNQYVAGGSNQAILRNFCRYFQTQTCDLAIIMWSHWSRNEIHIDEKVIQIQPASQSFKLGFVENYYKNRNEDVDWLDFLDKIWICENICPTKIIQGCCFALEKDFQKPNSWFDNNMHDLAMKKTPCGHPHLSEHKSIARKFINHIDKNNLL